ncbi:MAG: ABC transporter permease [Vicinamibacteria bacterium]|nr:ABC transporter permease [Vicinamibacteria bacterium]
MDTLRQDLMYAVRRLLMAPAFTFIAVATLALGIGANSAIFSIVYAVLLKPLPFPEPERLVQLYQVSEGRNVPYFSPQNFLDTGAEAKAFESVTAVDTGGVTLTGGAAPAVLNGAEVSASFFNVFKVTPELGRAIRPHENEPENATVVVLGHSLWQSRFGGDPKIIGQSIRLDSRPFTVVGVAPKGFSFPDDTELWTPLAYDAVFRTHSRGAWYLRVFGRLNPGVPLTAAVQETKTIADRLARAYPDANEGLGGAVLPLQEAMVGSSRSALYLLLGAVGLVLLIACVNVANLLMARAAAREGEFALRQALGAGRARILRQLMTESVLLGAIGGAAGLFVASMSMDSLIALQPSGVKRLSEAHVDPAVMAFAAFLSLVTGLLCGVLPGLAARRAPAQALREGARGLLAGRSGRVRGGLVVGQMALAMMLLAGAGLLLRSFEKLQQVKPGFDVENALTFRIALPAEAYKDEARRVAFFDRLLESLSALPGARGAAAILGLPLNGAQLNISFEVSNRPKVPPSQQPSMEMRAATPSYFKTMGIPVLRGRGIEPGDVAGARQVVVLSQSAVKKYFPNEDPIGQSITLGWRRPEGQPKAGGEVVGVVADVKTFGLAKDVVPEIYLPYAQLPVGSMDVLVRTSVPPMSLGPAVEQAVHALDADIPVARLRSLEDVVSRSISQPRFYMLLLGIFASMAVLLAALGIFGVMSYAVAQRAREIGIRMALGARPASVMRMVLGNAATLILSGIALGLAGALVLSRTLSGLLFNLSPTDPTTLGGVAILLTAVALVASFLPARQATRVDPLQTLRSE